MARGGRGNGGDDGNIISGSGGSDILEGFGGSYFLSGGKGDDIYYVDDAGDIVDEKNNGGTDRVVSLIDYTLGDNLENLTLDGSADLSGTGNDAANEITGNAGDNLLTGAGGSDTIDGGAGSDTAVLEGLSTDYVVTWDGDDLHLTGPEGDTDILRNVEYLLFADGLIAVADISEGSGDLLPPQAVDDLDATLEDTAAVISVLSNDLGEGISITLANNGAKGLVTVNPDGTLTYRPNENAFGTDSFTYTITDALGRESTATVTVQIAATNDAPVANADSYTASTGTTFTSSVSVLANDSDIDGDPLSVVGAGWDFNLDMAPGAASYQTATSAGGSVTVNADGTFTYTPTAGFTGTDSFTYAVGDGNGAHDMATVSVTVEPDTGGTDGGVPYYISGLLAPNDWNRMNWPADVGSSVTVTFAFLDRVPDYYAGWSADQSTFTSFTDQQKEAARQLLDSIASVTAITFVETAEAEAGLTFGTIQLGATRGLAFDPSGSGVGAGASDVWLDVDFAGDVFPQDSEALSILLHEIGHALGLEHPGLPGLEDNQQYSIMSGKDHPGLESAVQSLQLYDVAALQYLYGANMTHAAGDDVYTASDLEGRAIAIWDAGGIDLIDLSDAGYAVSVDLREGAFSTVDAAHSNNVGIAFGTRIENVTGSAFGDQLIGNDAANRIEGGLGDDDLTGGGGQDIFVGAVGSGSDVVRDFIRGEDRIDLSATGKAFADLTISSDAAGTVVAWGSGQMLLEGVQSVGAEDFVL